MAAITVLDKNNVPVGPFTREQIAVKLSTGECTPEQLAFVEGLAQWTPLRDVLAKVDGESMPPAPASIRPSVITPEAYSYAATMQSPEQVVYAGFWLRFVALILDRLIVGIPMLIISVIIGATFGVMMAMGHPGQKPALMGEDGHVNVPFAIMELGVSIFSLVVNWLYFALLESGPKQATFGKRIIGIKVTGLEGERIGFGTATGRFFGKILSALILFIGFMMAGFTEKKQALHDMLAGTLVIKS